MKICGYRFRKILFLCLAFAVVVNPSSSAAEFDIDGACSEAYSESNNQLNACIRLTNIMAKECRSRSQETSGNGAIISAHERSGDCGRTAFEKFMNQVPPEKAGSSTAAKDSGDGTKSAAADYPQNAESCKTQTDQAKKFCADPLSAMTDSELSSSPETMSAISGLSTMAMALVGGSKGAAAYCKALERGGVGLFGANGAFAVKCNSYINDCEKSCGDAIAGATAAHETEIAGLKRLLSQCESQKSRVIQFTSASVNSALAAKMADACKQSAQMNYTPAPMPTITAPDCASAANANNPMCKTISIGDYSNVGSGLSPATAEGKALSAEDMNVGDLPDLPQASVTGGATGEASKNGGVPNGGGQMVGGGGGSGKVGDGGGGRAPASLKSADVLQGERGGGGYVSPSGGFNSASGWGGYGQTGENQGKSGGFDLAKYLPGQDKAPLRGPAGLGSARVELAPMYEDIFKKISDRFLIVCRTNRQKCN